MSLYFEKARELGNMLLESEVSKNLADAREVYNATPEAIKRMDEYAAYQDNIRESMEKGVIGQEELHAATQRLAEMARELKQDPVIGALIFAENEFNGFVNQVMNVLKTTIMGESGQSDCQSGDCASCAGCR